MYNKKTKEEIIETCDKFGLEWIDGEYSNIYSKLKCKDKNNFLYNITLNVLLNGSVPSILNKYNPYSLYNLRLYFRLYKPNIELLIEKYEGYDVKFAVIYGILHLIL